MFCLFREIDSLQNYILPFLEGIWFTKLISHFSLQVYAHLDRLNSRRLFPQTPGSSALKTATVQGQSHSAGLEAEDQTLTKQTPSAGYHHDSGPIKPSQSKSFVTPAPWPRRGTPTWTAPSRDPGGPPPGTAQRAPSRRRR